MINYGKKRLIEKQLVRFIAMENNEKTKVKSK
jgi:hypothetical protein